MGRPKRKVSTSSEDDVMVMSSDGEDENKDPSLNEKTVSSILTRVTRSGRKSSRINLTDQKNVPLGTRQNHSKDNGASRDLIEISDTEDTPLPKRRKTNNSVAAEKDPLGDSEDLDSEFDKLDSLKEILSKSSVSITLHGSKVLPNDPGSSVKTPNLRKPPLTAGKEAAPIQARTGVAVNSAHTSDRKDSSSVRGQNPTNKLQTPGKIRPGIQPQPRLPGNTVVRSVRTPVVRPVGRPQVTPAVRPGVRPVARPTGKPQVPIARDQVVKALEKPPVVKEKKLPKVIDRGPMDCFDSLIVETSVGFPCNYCEIEKLFAKRREIAHMQEAHKDELVSDEQRNPDLSGLFPCSVCGNIFHSKFTRRTHEKAHTKILTHPCDRYYRYYLTTAKTK